MQEFEVELAIGDTLHVGNQTFTVIDIDGDEISVRVERDDETGSQTVNRGSGDADGLQAPRPR